MLHFAAYNSTPILTVRSSVSSAVACYLTETSRDLIRNLLYRIFTIHLAKCNASISSYVVAALIWIIEKKIKNGPDPYEILIERQMNQIKLYSLIVNVQIR